MNIKDFLIDNYIWILAIILISIVTIIGFLADKKKNDKKKDSMSSPPPQSIEPINNNQPQMQYQPMKEQQMNNNQQNIAMNNLNQMSDSMNQNISMNQIDNNQNIGTVPQQVGFDATPQNNINSINTPQPVENIVREPQQESIYQPLSEQKPNIPPQPIPNFDAYQNNPQQNTNQSQNIVDNNFVVPNMMQQDGNLNNGNNQMIQEQPTTINPQPMISELSAIPQQNYNPQPNMNNNSFTVPNMIPNINQGTVPQPINPIPIPQPVNPQPINVQPMMQNQMMENNQFTQNQMYGMNQPMSNNFPSQQPMPINQPIVQEQQAMQQPSLNFVYGPQNNNQNM